MMKSFKVSVVGVVLACSFMACNSNTEAPAVIEMPTDSVAAIDSLSTSKPEKNLYTISMPSHVKVKNYFSFMDSMIAAYDSLLDYGLNEYILVHANPWIIDSLESYDYYIRKEKGEFIEDQKETFALRKGAAIVIPTQELASQIQATLNTVVIDVNIPEFKLRIFENDTVKYTYPVRVGRNERKYLAMAGREISLRTPIGEGEIVRIEKNPTFINPSNNHRYYATKRDDGVYTKLPQIPWLEPSIGGMRPGSLIHPTTNPETLGKAYSNGCVGTPEGAAWRIYYYAPLGTKVRFRYDLDVVNETGDTLQLKDIYNLKGKSDKQLLASLKALYESDNPWHNHTCQEMGICH